MEKKEENNTEINQSFKLSAIVGIWESLNLHPTVMIYPSKKKYFLSMLHVSDNGQAKPAVYEIQKRIMQIVGVITGKQVSIGNFIDNVLEEHLNTHNDVLSALYREEMQKGIFNQPKEKNL